MIEHHSHGGAAAYHDLLRLLRDQTVSELTGSVVEVTRGGRTYLYDRFRLGDKVVDRYIGPATPDLRARIDRAAELKAGAAARTRERTRLVRVLRAEGYYTLPATIGSIVAAMEALGMFRLGGTLVGTIAFLCYEGELGLRLTRSELAQTGDVDIASFERLSVTLGDRVIENPGTALAALKFEPVPALDGHKVWRWAQTRRETMVEFLTPAFGDETIRDLPALGVSAQALHYLNYLIAEPIPAAALYRSGLLVQIPRPERFAIHKLIVADRRRDGTDSLKARKDRAQSALLVEALAESRPDELAEAWGDAQSRGPRWRERLARSLARMPETAARLAALGS